MSDLQQKLIDTAKAVEAALQIADILAAYRKRLVDNGVPEDLADDMTRDMQSQQMDYLKHIAVTGLKKAE